MSEEQILVVDDDPSVLEACAEVLTGRGYQVHEASGGQEALNHLALLNDIGSKIAAVLELDKLLDRAVRLVQESFGYHHVALFTLDRERNELAMRVRAGAFTSLFPPDHRVGLSQGMVGWVARHGETLLANDVGAEPNYINFFPEVIPTRSELSVPIRMREEIVGVLDVQSPRLHAFRENDVTVLETLADQLAVAIENARLYESVQRELSERKQAEQALRESTRQLEDRELFITRILESIPSSLVVIDRSLRIVAANRNFLEKARRKEQATLGRKIEEVFPHVLVEYTRLADTVREVFRTGRPVEGGKVSYRAPGVPTRIYYYRLIPLKHAPPVPSRVEGSGAEGAKETVENVMLLLDDITEREQLREDAQRAERHLASVVECANDLVVSLDPEGQIITWNRAAEGVSGLRAEKVKGRSLPSLCAVPQREVIAEMLRRLARGESVRNTEVNLLTTAGQEVPIAWSTSSMRDDNGRIVGIVAVGRDLTERRQLETQLVHSAKMASLGVMAGGIAHEVRNPLGIISASAQLLLERPDDARLQGECAQKICTATQRASMIIEGLLKFARPQSARMEKVSLHTVLQETISLLAHQMALQQITLEQKLQPDLPAVYGNATLLQQVFTNLILNACNAMPQGGTLTVSTQIAGTGGALSRSMPGPAPEIEIRFSDTGKGIPPEHLPHIFDPFFTTMPVGKGTGLGLSITYSIIQQHQGTIEVESHGPDQGTTFTVRLPGAR
jgi:PAS domain S-box-containing protein